MSRENVDLVLAFHGAYNAGKLDAAIGFCADDIKAFPDASVIVTLRDGKISRVEWRRRAIAYKQLVERLLVDPSISEGR